MPTAVFEPTISAGERPQTYALDARLLEPVVCWLIEIFYITALMSANSSYVYMKQEL